MDYNQFLISGKLTFIKTGATNKGLSFADFTLQSISKKYPNLISLVSYGEAAEQVKDYVIGDRIVTYGRVRSKQIEDRIFPVFIAEKINKIDEPRREGENS